MARRGNAGSVAQRIRGVTGAYRGNTGSHNIAVRGNQFASHNTNYRNLRRAFGLSAG